MQMAHDPLLQYILNSAQKISTKDTTLAQRGILNWQQYEKMLACDQENSEAAADSAW